MMNLRASTLLIVFIVALVNPAFADGGSVLNDFQCKKDLGGSARKALLAAMDKRFLGISGFSADFTQLSRMLAGTRTVSNSGRVSFLKPGRMNWVYQEPRQRFISDGKTVWFYQPEMENGQEKGGEVTLIDFSSAFTSETPGSFLLGLGTLAKDFNLVTGCETGAGYLAELKPKVEDENLEEFHLLVRKHDNVSLGAKIVDFSENETIIRFHNLRINPGLEDSSFNFDIPRGVFVEDHRRRSSSTQ
jgi:chaperone LolA